MTRRARSKPASTCIRFQKLRISRPAPTTSTTASATSETTSAPRIRALAVPAVVRAPDSLSAAFMTGYRHLTEFLDKRMTAVRNSFNPGPVPLV